MELPLKKTQTLIGSRISNIISNIYLRKPKGQWGKVQVQSSEFVVLSLIALVFFLLLPTAYAVTDPLSTANNRFGIHIISAVPQEASEAAEMVNSSGGDWGYITFLIESKDRDPYKWQTFFDDLRRRHLIPIVRLATKPVSGGFWEVPQKQEYEAWADFLDRLNWPIKNRFVTIYNEPNHSQEWGNFVDPKSYAKVLDKTITALKNKNQDFFVLNAGFDASTPHEPPSYYDQERFMVEMNQAIPGIFNKLDGWVSHSYPNPGFIGLPQDIGRGTVRTYLWELQLLKTLGVTKELPIFITETGWRHSAGIQKRSSLPTPETVSQYYQQAFDIAWNDPRIVAVTPFLLNYQQPPFDHFSFKMFNSHNYHPQYLVLKDMPKVMGQPVLDLPPITVELTPVELKPEILGESASLKIVGFWPIDKLLSLLYK